MEILGVGPLELVFILLLVLIIFGPRDLQKAGRTLGRSLNKLVRSDGWRAFNQISKNLLTLPNKMMRDANLDEMKENLEKTVMGVDGSSARHVSGQAGITIPTPEGQQPGDETGQPPADQ